MPHMADSIYNASVISRLIDELQTLKEEWATAHEQNIKEHSLKMEELNVKIQEAQTELERAKKIQKGDPGAPGEAPIKGVHYFDGEPGAPADETAIEKRVLASVLPKIPKVKDGVTPKKGVDYHTESDIKDIVRRSTAVVLSNIRQPKDGETPVIDHAKIAEDVVKKIIEEKLLKPEHIHGLTSEIASYRNQLAGKVYGRDTQVRGGGDTIAAGTNVTISNVNGVKTISASGGSGFTTLTATETPDGLTSIFTFAAATAQPSFLLLDFVWTPAVSKNGTVNWTWNNGTKKATVNVPPLADILGVV